MNEYFNMSVNFSKSSKDATINMSRPPTLDLEDLKKVNEKVQELSSLSPDYAPSFIAKDKIAFMSSDMVILCYKVFDSDEEKNNIIVKKVGEKEGPRNNEVFNVAQSVFPGSTGEISLDTLQLVDSFLIGENVMLLERRP